MKIKTKKLFVVLIGTLTLGTLVKVTIGELVRQKKPLSVWIPSEPFSADPIESGFIAHEMAFRSIHAPLVTRHKLGETVGLLAASWRSENQAKSWLVSLRPGLKWSTGAPLTAHDVKMSFLRLARNLGKKDPLLGKLDGISNLKDLSPGFSAIQVLNETEIRFHFQEPIPDFPTVISASRYGVTHSSQFEPIDGKWRKLPDPISSGAYKIARWTPQEILLELRKDWPVDLTHERPLQEIALTWGGPETKAQADIALGHSIQRDLSETHLFVGGPMTGISFVRCHPWKIRTSVCGSKKIAAALRDQFYRELETRGLRPERDFLPDPDFRNKKFEPAKWDVTIDSKSFDQIKALKATGKLNPFIGEFNTALLRATSALNLPSSIEQLSSQAVLGEKDPNLKTYQVTLSARATELDFEALQTELKVFFVTHDGLRLPDREGRIQNEILSGAPSIRVINQMIYDDAAIWPLAHFSQGLFFKKSKKLDSTHFNPMLPPGEYQWLGQAR